MPILTDAELKAFSKKIEALPPSERLWVLPIYEALSQSDGRARAIEVEPRVYSLISDRVRLGQWAYALKSRAIPFARNALRKLGGLTTGERGIWEWTLVGKQYWKHNRDEPFHAPPDYPELSPEESDDILASPEAVQATSRVGYHIPILRLLAKGPMTRQQLLDAIAAGEIDLLPGDLRIATDGRPVIRTRFYFAVVDLRTKGEIKDIGNGSLEITAAGRSRLRREGPNWKIETYRKSNAKVRPKGGIIDVSLIPITSIEADLDDEVLEDDDLSDAEVEEFLSTAVQVLPNAEPTQIAPQLPSDKDEVFVSDSAVATKPLKIFISHNQNDRSLALAVADALRSQNHVIFDNFQIASGQPINEFLAEGLRTSDVLISIWSKNTINSTWIISEMATAKVYAKQRSMLLLPVILDDIGLPGLIADIYCIRSPERDLQHVVGHVLRALHRFAEERRLAPPPEGDIEPLRYPNEWRYGEGVKEAPVPLVEDLFEVIRATAESLPRQEKGIVETFKERFGARAASKDLDFAYRDLRTAMQKQASNGPRFVEGIWLGIQDASKQNASVPLADRLNQIFKKHGFPYVLAPPDLRHAPGASLAPFEPGENDAPAPAASPREPIPVRMELAPSPTIAPAAPLIASVPAASAHPPPAFPAPRASSGHTVTLHVEKARTRLFDGLNLDGDGQPAWERPYDLDWSSAYFTDSEQRACTLAAAFRDLPTVWDQDTVETFGSRLAELLFGSPIPAPVRERLRVVGEQRRLVLVLDREHMPVPWEYLRIGEYFIAEQRLSIVRHVESDAPARSLIIDKPQKVLFAYSNPRSRHYDGDAHQKRIVTAIQGLDAAIHPALTCTYGELEALLCNNDGQVFHYLGHGEEGGSREAASLTLHGDGGVETRACPAETLAKWVRDRPRDLVVLGSCFGGAVPEGGLLLGVGGRIVHASATPVVAMQMEVPQEFSTAFVARFYRELKAASHDIEVAVFLARRAECQERHAFGIPVLLTDATNLPPLATLQRPKGEPERWASFAVAANLPPEEARMKWRTSAVLSPATSRAVDRAIEANARAGYTTDYPPPPDDASAVGSRLAELERRLTIPAACEALRSIGAPAPATAIEPAALTGGRIVPINDVPLSARLTSDLCRAAIDRVEGKLSLPGGLVARIVGELRAGNHVMLTGPVGTGKTSLAREVTEALGYRVHLDTASADWTRFEVLGGFWPTTDGSSEKLSFKFRAGVFLEAVQVNWRPQPRVEGVAETAWRREPHGEEHGMWLVLDELNRADMDRALGGIFTALESLKLRVPTSDGDGRTVEIPIPQDFRVIATINIADRHFLFRLSDALKRRFAFVHVPVTTAWNDEWERLCRAVGLPADIDATDLRRFVALVRIFHPLGTALVQAALKFCATSDFLVSRPAEWPLAQAIEGAILPNLEDLRDAGLQALCAWTEARELERLATAVKDGLPPDLSAIEGELLALAGLPPQLSPGWHDGDDAVPDRANVDLLAQWIARRVARPPDAGALPLLKAAIAGLKQGATSH